MLHPRGDRPRVHTTAVTRAACLGASRIGSGQRTRVRGATGRTGRLNSGSSISTSWLARDRLGPVFDTRTVLLDSEDAPCVVLVSPEACGHTVHPHVLS